MTHASFDISLTPDGWGALNAGEFFDMDFVIAETTTVFPAATRSGEETSSNFSIPDTSNNIRIRSVHRTTGDPTFMPSSVTRVLQTFECSVDGGAFNFSGRCDFSGGLQNHPPGRGSVEVAENWYSLRLPIGVNRIGRLKIDVQNTAAKCKFDVDLD